MITAEVTKWVVLILVIALVIFVIKAGMKILNILVMVGVLAFAWFSFFSEEGAARLSIVLMGRPITAYTTKLEKVESLSTDSEAYYTSSKEIIVDGQKQEYVKCYTKWIIRIPSVKE